VSLIIVKFVNLALASALWETTTDDYDATGPEYCRLKLKARILWSESEGQSLSVPGFQTRLKIRRLDERKVSS